MFCIALACSKIRPECWKDDRPMNCDPAWCYTACTDAQAFHWLGQYDHCLQEWTDADVAVNPLTAKEVTAKNHCYAWFLEHHQGITKEQMEKYRLLNPAKAR
jgi:hypothetical protein